MNSLVRHKSVKVVWLALLTVASASLSFAQTEVLPEVFLSGKVALSERYPLHFLGTTPGDSVTALELDSLDRVLVRDLTLSGLFDLRLPDLSPDSARSKSAVTMTYLDGDLQGGVSYRAVFRLRSAYRAEPFWVNEYEFPVERTRAAAHRIAADVIRQMTGEPSVMQTRIAFRAKMPQGQEILSVSFDGFDLVQMTHAASPVFSPAWSPDGARLAYTGFQNGQADLFIVDMAAGDNHLYVGSPGVDQAPDWSPDGSRLAYSTSVDGGNSEIFVRSADGLELKRLTYSWAIETSPSWSPTGREIAFTSDRMGKPQVFIMDADGANQRRLTGVGDYNDSPAWSPRGDMIAYVRRDREGFQIYLTDPAGEKHVRLTSGPGDNMDPCWAPDGLRIAFASNRTGMFQIYTMDIFGRSVERVTHTNFPCNNPSWSPVLQDSGEIIITSKK